MAWDKTIRAGCLGLAAVLLAGCYYVPAESKPAQPVNDPLDPCPTRLHNLAGVLLDYFVAHQDLPPDLQAVKEAGGAKCPPLVCPDSKAPYSYNPAGLEIPGLPGRVVLYDSVACHHGEIWAIVLKQIGRSNMLEAKVLLLPAKAIPTPPATAKPAR